ncbi:NAD-dependent epimerase/dehydratase family protein [Marinobacter nanhaiticus D15-8W]|uniref:NAD-dependent epimerase/dehydratase family protein n=1 Tax=Marinobacter nanhaiticus D15-8W TaxID=626887 RepID=N6VTC7_9GAMM|nr:SDR family oxidoreductase [Marinobacter nanhaiticus]ENO13420.1 NAD-dependent epimerase/dehydratase family protein [Marinobacter nanhaiticus D15-8W]
MLKKLFITGGAGFVGSAILNRLARQRDMQIFAHFRQYNKHLPASITPIVSSSFAALPDPMFLQGVQVVIHSAARVHVMEDDARDPMSEFRKVNVQDTLSLARQAAQHGVSRFVFISSIKVNGERTPQGRAFTPEDDPAQEDPYGISKMEAERGLQQLARCTGMEVVIIRPPLVYGPGVKGNFASLIKLVEKGLPLPLGAIPNRRSLVGVDNLVDLIITCIDHPAAANQVFLVSDGEDLSTPELLRRLAAATGRRSLLISVPPGLLELVAILIGKRAMVQRLLSSLQVDISKTQSRLGWEPPFSVDEGLRRCFIPENVS